MMNEKVRAAIFNLSTLSTNARKIADRLGVEISAPRLSATAGADDVQALKQEIEKLNTQLTELKTYLANLDEDDDEDNMSDDEKIHFGETFSKTLSGQSFGLAVQIYDENYLRAFPRHIRFLVCSTLVNWCANNKNTVPQFWYDVMTNNGSL